MFAFSKEILTDKFWGLGVALWTFYLHSAASEIVNGISWTSDLDTVFDANRHEDPSLSWQYFGSDKGFMRTYPGMMFNYLNYLIVLFFNLTVRPCMSNTLKKSIYFQPNAGTITIQIKLIYMTPGYDLGKVVQNLLVCRTKLWKGDIKPRNSKICFSDWKTSGSLWISSFSKNIH